MVLWASLVAQSGMNLLAGSYLYRARGGSGADTGLSLTHLLCCATWWWGWGSSSPHGPESTVFPECLRPYFQELQMCSAGSHTTTLHTTKITHTQKSPTIIMRQSWLEMNPDFRAVLMFFFFFFLSTHSNWWNTVMLYTWLALVSLHGYSLQTHYDFTGIIKSSFTTKPVLVNGRPDFWE